MSKAKFIVIEGLEGAGKSTAIKAILEALEGAGVKSIQKTREPGGTALAEQLRTLVKQEHEGEELQDMTELLLMYAARVQLVENVIKPALASGRWVVGDRHDMSSQAYQGGGRELSQKSLLELKRTTLGDFKPDLTIYLDIDPQVGLARARGRGELDRIEKMDMSFFERTRKRYLELAANDNDVITIDAEQSISAVANDIQSKLSQWLELQS
ncbi:dTMP kinase [Vibrio pectenicida]|uniref:Thymidylate kinase n=1 Tax=Vibrio pectenicida TaxID=62763 RepID=A0A7Y3ZXL2_9VIBR|nr:dTMP kinase [Vibrio pectenicida]NOH70950.1 dTMP kinase [Vibrio pectenicida]